MLSHISKYIYIDRIFYLNFLYFYLYGSLARILKSALCSAPRWALVLISRALLLISRALLLISTALLREGRPL